MEWLYKSFEGAVENGSYIIKVVESHIETFDANVKEIVGNESSTFENDELPETDFTDPRFAHLKITDGLKAFIKKLVVTPDVILTHPLANVELESSKLTPEQQRHAIDILGQVPELSGLRYQLCPSQIKEIPFWKVYFDLISKIQEPLEVIQIADVEENVSYAEKEKESLRQDQRIPQTKKSCATEAGKTRDSEYFLEDYLEVQVPFRGELQEEDSYFTDFTFASYLPNPRVV